MLTMVLTLVCWTLALLQVFADGEANWFELQHFRRRLATEKSSRQSLAGFSIPLDSEGKDLSFKQIRKVGSSQRNLLYTTGPHGGLGTRLQKTVKTELMRENVILTRRLTDFEAILKAARARDLRRKLQTQAAQSVCEADIQRLVNDPGGSYECHCQANGADGYRLRCKSDCGEYCNEEFTVCGKKEITRAYDASGRKTLIETGFEYTRGFTGLVAIRQTGCTDDGSGAMVCSECAGIVDGSLACDACDLQMCSDGQQAPLLDCKNINDGAVFDFCEGNFDIPEGDFEYLSSGEFAECVDPIEAPMSACEDDALFWEGIPDKEYKCSCKENSLGSVTLTCRNNCGEYCNPEKTICGTEVYDQVYDLKGNPTKVANNFFYSKGVQERLVVLRESCNRPDIATPDGIFCTQCSVRVGQISSCTSCSIQTCEDGSEAVLANCENIDSGGIFNLCNPASIQVEGGVFDYFSSAKYTECVDNSPENDVCSDGGSAIEPSAVFLIGNTTSAINDGVQSCEPGSDGPGLWYNVQGTDAGLLASTCSDRTNFDTQISVYTGSCNNLTCVASNDDATSDECIYGHSAVNWFGEAGVVYRIRVGGFLVARGQFELYLNEVDLASETCNSAKAALESVSSRISGSNCTCVDVGKGSQSLSCLDTCSYCNEEGSVCASRTYGGTFNAESVLHTKFIENQYTLGRSELVRIEDFNCSDSQGCAGCRATVNGTECGSCKIVDCVDQFGNNIGDGRQIDCTNVDGTTIWNQCDDPMTEQESGVFDAWSSSEAFTRCVQEPMEACQSLAARRREAYGASCSCTADAENAIISCIDGNCRFCNTETTVCEEVTYGGTISGKLGEISKTFEEHKYIEGRSEVLRFEKFGDQCSFSVNETMCNSCEFVTCSDDFGGYDGASINCSNIESGAVFSDCDPPEKRDGILEAYSYREFDECLEEKNPEEICLEQKEIAERIGEETGTSCECLEDPIAGGHTLRCTDSDCVFCNFYASVCASNTYGSSYGRFGQVVSDFNGYQYIEGGRDEEIVFVESDGLCNVTVDKELCSSCKIVQCTESIFPYDDYEVDCANIPDGASFLGCESVVVDSGVLEVATDYEFNECITPRSSEDACLEASPSKADCTCTPNEYGGHTLSCVDKSCIYCNDERTACGYKIQGTKFGRLGQELEPFYGFQYVEGRNSTIIFGPVRDPSDPRNCTVAVDDTECASCIVKDCGFDFGLHVQCDNVVGGGNFDECDSSTRVKSALAFFSPKEFNECIDVSDPMDFCKQQKEFMQLENPDFGTFCDCTSAGDGAKLSCTDTLCQFCNENKTVCLLDVAYGGDIGKHGFYVSTFGVSEYIEGRDERVVIEQTPPTGCRVTIDGQECSSCKRIQCPGAKSVELVIDCSNVVEGASYFGCKREGNDLFGLLSDDAFNTCVHFEGTFPPTESPAVTQVESSSTPTQNPRVRSHSTSICVPIWTALYPIFMVGFFLA